jgi:predicted dehydrogenase/NADPH:quinone reductase-like Zn-dependent oxidoreductase
MGLQKRAILRWGLTRARALLRRRGVVRGLQVVCHDSGWVRVEPFESLGPGPGELLVRTIVSAVSPGTERAQFNRLPNTQVEYPYTPGYAAVGVVAGVGAGVAGIVPGQRVAGQMGHASFACVPADACVPVPDGVGDAEAAFTTLGVIALQGVRKAGIGFADRVAVLGRGLLGTLSARLAGIAGAATVDLLGRGEAREAVAGQRRYEVVLDVTGNPGAIADAARLAAEGARIVLVGSSRGRSPGLAEGSTDGGAVEVRGAHARMRPMTASAAGRWTFGDEATLYMDLVRSGRLVPFDPPAEVLDPRECWRFYRRLGRGEPPVVAAVFDWGRVPAASRLLKATALPPEEVFKDDVAQERTVRRVPRLAGRRSDGTQRRRDTAMAAGAGTTRNLGIAFVGCGEIALRNAQAVADSEAMILRWAIDPDLALATDLTRRWGGQTAADVARALEDPGTGAVIVCTPHHLHEPIARQAIAAGKHVLLEKPTARNAAEARRILDAARAARVVVSTCYPRRFLAETIAAKALVREGSIGPLAGARIAEHLYRETSYWHGGSSGRSRSNWRASRETSGGGVLLMNVSHLLDVLLSITGRGAERVYCESARHAAPGDVEDLVALTLTLEGGVVVSVSGSTCAPGAAEQVFQIFGSEGQMALDEPPRFLALRPNPYGPANEWARLPRGTEREARRDFMRAFASAVVQGAANPVPDDEALAVQELIDVAYESARRHEPLPVSPTRGTHADAASSR